MVTTLTSNRKNVRLEDFLNRYEEIVLSLFLSQVGVFSGKSLQRSFH